MEKSDSEKSYDIITEAILDSHVIKFLETLTKYNQCAVCRSFQRAGALLHNHFMQEHFPECTDGTNAKTFGDCSQQTSSVYLKRSKLL